MKCPHCNKDLNLTSLYKLKLHITSQVMMNWSYMERQESQKESDERITRTLETVLKWAHWLDDIITLERKANECSAAGN